ncbi:hypothetical protein A3A38_04525 [Candidatus Kaiserbacteria bacterium RIFCSPLOWO2_01_FULL_53_17]|uniref:Uncharacterized protein n=1 Tax=Candidatus Kaiserbacteria bacterium RIFCSPLOWO2_01_FULL_53_17 TaxID=1798511 RepID=A0A1F6EH52_9BACT|nr:MAG: hypothetical protein A3A38_04525 [Candidatus Kaiserbacteria bacterium RIFCSPLOWO2_01_FULL_53_17]
MEPEFDFSKGGNKTFVEGFHARIINGLLHIVLTSGEKKHAFTLPLDLTKKLSRGLTAQVAEIEAKNNIVIDGRLPNEPMVSPIQAKPIDGETK